MSDAPSTLGSEEPSARRPRRERSATESLLRITLGMEILAVAFGTLAINGLGRVMAMELAKDNIRVNTICPGFNDTSRLSDLPRGEAFDKMVAEQVPLGRADDGTQVAELTLFLVSDRAQWITGQTMMADGGRVWGH